MIALTRLLGLQQLPGVEFAGVTALHQFGGDGWCNAVSVVSDTNELTNAYIKLFLVACTPIEKIMRANETRRFLKCIVNVQEL
jgi:hypothetical protein